jgi:hypothetical protein
MLHTNRCLRVGVREVSAHVRAWRCDRTMPSGVALPWILALTVWLSSGFVATAGAQQVLSDPASEVGSGSPGLDLAPPRAWTPPQASALLFPGVMRPPVHASEGFVQPVPFDDPAPSEDLVRARNDAMLNGAMIIVGALGVFDNVVVHWILGWHRIIEDHPHALELEIAAVAVSTAMLATGIVRERNARRRAGVEQEGR